MGRVVKWLGWGLLGLAVVAVAAVAVIYNAALNTVQPVQGNARIAGLSAAVETVRDAHGIPHIVAETKVDAMAALGFAHAQDRLWQMEVHRMTGQGRLSEMFGDATVDIDRFLRTLGFLPQVEASIKALSSENQALLAAYAEGVNAFLRRETNLLEPSLPPEFLILGHEPEPWQPAHSLLILKIMSLQLSMNMDREMKRLHLAAQGLNPAEIADILPGHRLDTPPPLPDLRKLYELSPPPPEETETALVDNRRQPLMSARRILDQTGIWASNNWVLSGSRTESGKPLLANDPHLVFGAPSLWYLAHLQWKDGDGSPRNVIGASIPAVPAIVLGRNDHVAWGFTNAGADVQDVFIEQLRDEEGREYRTPDGWAEFDTRDEVIRVKGADDVAFSVRTGRHGPVLPGTYRDLDAILPKQHVAALAWTGMSETDRSFEIVSDLAETNSVGDLRKSFDRSVSPMQVVVAADSDGNIGLFAPAHVPVRPASSTMKGRAPVPGWTGEHDWQGLVPVDQLPAYENPASGALGSANSRIDGIAAEPFLTYDWDETYRQDRVFSAVLGNNKPQTVDDMIAGQTDDHSAAMLDMRDALLNQLDGDGDHAEAVAMLRDWDGQMDAARPEPLIITAFHRNLLEAMFADELGPAFDAVLTASATVPIRVLNGQGARDWCDDGTTGEEESCADTVNAAFDAAIDELEAIHGADMSTWTWGAAHTIFNEHRPFSSVWPLSKLFDIERPTSGGNYALRRGKSTFSDKSSPYRATHGAGYRAVYDFADLDRSIFIQTTGQSGNPFSSHYDDFADLWAEGQYIIMTTRPEDYTEGAQGTWQLEPAQ